LAGVHRKAATLRRNTTMNMDRAIFALKASVEATSLYILLCALLDQGAPPTLEHARAKWNGTDTNLATAAQELMQRGVLETLDPITEETPLTVNPSSKWHFLH
jgi:hypothetical protein